MEPLTELTSTNNIIASADGTPEDEEARWKRWCTEAGVPDAYIPPGKAESDRNAKKVRAAKKKRHDAMRKSIARANATAAPAAGTLDPPPPPPQPDAERTAPPDADKRGARRRFGRARSGGSAPTLCSQPWRSGRQRA